MFVKKVHRIACFEYRRNYKLKNNLSSRNSVRWSAVPVAPVWECGCVMVRGAVASKGLMTYAVSIVFDLEAGSWDLVFKAGIRPSGLWFGLQDFDLGLEPGIWAWRFGTWLLRHGIWASRLGFEPPGWGLSLQAEIWATKLGYGPRSWNLVFQARI